MHIREAESVYLNEYDDDNVNDFIEHIKLLGIPKIYRYPDRYIVHCFYNYGNLMIEFILENLNDDEREIIDKYYEELKEKRKNLD